MTNSSNYNPEIHNRRSIRLNGYDYTQEGAYFVTLCTYQKVCIFGGVAGVEMKLNEYGQIVRDEWLKSADIRAEIELGEFVVMPNHFHGIVYILLRYGHMPAPSQPEFRSPSKTIGAMVRGFKSSVTTRINEIRHAPGVPVWQRNYWERIIRNENEYRNLAEYILYNPAKWDLDKLHTME